MVKIENNLISNARVLLTLSWAGFRQILNTLIYSHGLLYNVAWYKHLFWFKVQCKWINSSKRLPLACVASVSVCFRRPRNGRDSRFWPREKWTALLLTPIFCAVLACVAGVERGRGGGNLGARESVWGARPTRSRTRPNSPFPFPFQLRSRRLARSLTLVPCSLLLNRTETLATQARLPPEDGVFFRVFYRNLALLVFAFCYISIYCLVAK